MDTAAGKFWFRNTASRGMCSNSSARTAECYCSPFTVGRPASDMLVHHDARTLETTEQDCPY